ncbi:Crp/Fnr family transcriptional regulator [Palleronia caenipelagi]|uniref:Crp/Fnr family transcriptional regulator n=1 Tax=Palleronia caenipelagi TaxID=2489174 RepID=A0A547PLZ6_9RHOB|nr:Crp/Fnr family transcriptional regulator [Palleronia caenipelagi]
MTTNWIDRFEGLARLPAGIKDTLTRQSAVVSLPKGAEVFGPGAVPDNLLLLLDGTVRVSQTSQSGREIVLYRVEAGQSCVLTTACLLAHEAYAAEGRAETDIRAAAIPRATFDRLTAESTQFRDFVFAAYARRITDLFRVIDEVAFGKIDMRLAQRLLELAPSRGPLKITHQQLATELGTAREVVSRQLAEFARRDLLSVGRGSVEITDADTLRRIASA